MKFDFSHIKNAEILIDLSGVLSLELLPSEDDVYKPFRKLLDELELFKFLEKTKDFYSILGMSKSQLPRRVTPYTILKMTVEDLPFVMFADPKDLVNIFLTIKELVITINAEKEEDGFNTIKEEKGELLEKVSTSLQTLISVLYARELLEEDVLEIPIKVMNKYEPDTEQTKIFLSNFLKEQTPDPSLGEITIEGIQIRFKKKPKQWILLGTTLNKTEKTFASEVSTILPVKDLNIINIVELNVTMTNDLLSKWGR